MLGLEPRLGVNWGFPSTQWPAAPYWVWGWFSNCWSSNPEFWVCDSSISLNFLHSSPLSISTPTAKGSSTCSHAAVGLNAFVFHSCYLPLAVTAVTLVYSCVVKQAGRDNTSSSDLSRCCGYHRTSASIPVSFSPLCPPCFESKKLLHSLQEQSPGFLQPSCCSRQSSNQPRILTFSMWTSGH